MTNAERQAKFKSRLKAQAASSDALLQYIRDRMEITRDRIEMFKSGRMAYWDMSDGQKDITHEAIARDEALLAADEKILAMYEFT